MYCTNCGARLTNTTITNIKEIEVEGNRAESVINEFFVLCMGFAQIVLVFILPVIGTE